MDETTIKFKYLWRAVFKNKVITQHPQDIYSKHDPKAEYNPSSFRDFQDYFDEHKDELVKFELISPDNTYTVTLDDPEYPKILCEKRSRWGSITYTLLHKEKRPLKNIRIIYLRKMEVKMFNGVIGTPRVEGYILGYQGIDKNGANRKKTISVV